MFDTVLLRTLLTVADAGGFTRAAEQLHLTQSAISAHIRRLEAEAGHKLLERTTRSVALTSAGAQLVGYARTILALHEDARVSLGAGRRLSGPVCLGVSEEMAKAPLLDCVRRFGVANPGAEVSVRIGLTGELVPSLRSGALDIVVGSRCGGEDGGEVLWSEPMVWAGGTIPLSGDAVVPLAVFPDQCPYRAAAIEALARAGRRWRVACQSPGFGGLSIAVNTGLGVTPVTRSFAAAAGFHEVTTLPALPPAQFVLMANTKPGRTTLALLTRMRRTLLRRDTREGT